MDETATAAVQLKDRAGDPTLGACLLTIARGVSGLRAAKLGSGAEQVHRLPVDNGGRFLLI